MRLRKPYRRVVRVNVYEHESGAIIPGSSHTLTIYEATSAEVFAALRETLERLTGEVAPPEETNKNRAAQLLRHGRSADDAAD